MTIAALLASGRTVGDRVDLLCRLHDIRTADLARAVGSRPQYIGRIRNKQIKRPNADLIDAIAAYFDVDDRLLRTGQPREARPEIASSAAEADESPNAEFEAFMGAVTAGARDDPQAREIIIRAVRLVLEDLERARLPRRGQRRVS
jgi:transcriptional regulator with XRE-family HTH domain